MSPSSALFVLFLLAVVALEFALPRRWRWVWLLAASYVFCISWSVRSAVALLASTVVAYVVGRLISAARGRTAKKALLWAGVSASILSLLAFKYVNSAIGSASSALSPLGLSWKSQPLALLLPVGISFWTLQIISYLFDVYSGAIAPETHLGRFALYLAFFPKLVAGPIERYAHLAAQLRREPAFDYQALVDGLTRIGWGLFKKLVIADRLAAVVNTVYAKPYAFHSGELFVAALFFAFQVYADFSAYCDIVIGAAKTMGIELTENFNAPFFATSVAEFWRRWHISLSTWMRIYVFLPLNFATRRKRSRLYLYAHIMITFVISGLWHGANWTYVIWGVLQGLYQMWEQTSLPLRNRALRVLGVQRGWPVHRAFQSLVTFAQFAFASIFFRAESIREALHIIQSIVTLEGLSRFKVSTLGLDAQDMGLAVLMIAVFLAAEWLQARHNLLQRMPRLQWMPRWAIFLAGLFAIIIFGYYGDTVPQQFIYALF